MVSNLLPGTYYSYYSFYAQAAQGQSCQELISFITTSKHTKHTAINSYHLSYLQSSLLTSTQWWHIFVFNKSEWMISLQNIALEKRISVWAHKKLHSINNKSWMNYSCEFPQHITGVGQVRVDRHSCDCNRIHAAPLGIFCWTNTGPS